MADDRPIRVELAIVLPTGERLTKTLTAETEWRQELDLPLREYVGLLLHRVTAEAHRWVAATLPAGDTAGRAEISATGAGRPRSPSTVRREAPQPAESMDD